MTTQNRRFKKQQSNQPPSCSGNKEVEMDLKERFQMEVVCSECGERFPVVEARKDDKAPRQFFQIPAHKVPEDVHEYRKKLGAT